MSTGLVPNAPLMDLHQQNVWEKPLWKKDTFLRYRQSTCIFSWNITFPPLVLAHFVSANVLFCADGLLNHHHWIPLKKYIWFHYHPKRVTVYCKSFFHGRTSVYEEYIECILVLIIRLPEFQETNSGKRKIRHATIVAIFWENCSKILRPNMNGEHFEKTNIKTTITYNNIFLC